MVGAANGNDNFKVIVSGAVPVFAFALTVMGNASDVDDSTNAEGFIAGGVAVPLPLTTVMTPSAFIGAISDDPITLILADESQTDGDATVLYSDFRFATVAPAAVPALSQLALLLLAGAFLVTVVSCGKLQAGR